MQKLTGEKNKMATKNWKPIKIRITKKTKALGLIPVKESATAIDLIREAREQKRNQDEYFKLS